MADQPSEPIKGTTLFLSYSRADERRARKLAAVLQAQDYEVWWDGLIEGGATYAHSIATALDMADAIIVLWSAHSIESDWVRDEASRGRERHRLIPLSLDGCAPPLGFGQYQVINLSHWHGRAGSPEIAAIERAIATVTQQATDARPHRKTESTRRGLLVGGAAAAGLTVAGSGAWLAWDRGLLGKGGATPLSIAVLPFRNLSGDAAQSYFSDGLTDEIRVALTRIGALDVLAGTSSAKASEQDSDPKAIARRLDVGYLLSGSIQRADDEVRIATDLTDGRTGFSRWSQSFDRKLTDIFAVQSDIARTVAQAMSVQVATSDPAPGGTGSVEAYEDYLRGRALYGLARDEPTDRTALADFDAAIAADPKFALARAARSRSLSSLAGEYAKAAELKPLYDEAIAEARRAVDLAPNLPEAHLALGYALFAGKLDIAAARPSYDRAYALGRGNAEVALLFALYCSRAGRANEAAAAVSRAVALDPLNPRAFRAQGSVAYAGRRYADALPPLRHALQLNPKMTFAHSLAGSALLGLGRVEEARKEFAAEPEEQFRTTGLAIAEHRLGNDAAAKRAFAELVSKVGDSALYQQAQVLAQWGRTDDALASLARARAVGDSGLTYAATDQLLDPIRKDPRFVRFVNDLRLA
jgi:TolB-like protein/Flp pilus assembly protein TadD